ncbi:MAG: Ig-like domain repeat protein, partial [bacterium]
DVTAPEIDQLSASPDPFEENVDVSYVLSESVDTTTINVERASDGVVIDSKVIDGQGGGEHVEGFSLPGEVEGDYNFIVQATDPSGNTSDTNSAIATLDRTAPGITIEQTPSPNPFSPDASPGVNDITEFAISTSGAEEVVISIVSQATGSEVVSQLDPTPFSGDLTSDTPITWDGASDGGEQVSEGDYTIRITATDEAGNSSQKSTVVTVDNTPFDVTKVDVDPDTISPENNDQNFEITTMSYEVQGTDTAQVNLKVTDSSDSIVREDTKFQSSEGSGFIQWEGVNNGENVVLPGSQGDFTMKILVTDLNTDKQVTRKRTVRVDNRKPDTPVIDVPNDGANVSQAEQTISGSSESPGSTIRVENRTTNEVKTTTVDILGNWSVTLTLQGGDNEIAARSRDEVLNSTNDTGPITVSLDDQAPFSEILRITEQADTSTDVQFYSGDTGITAIGRAQEDEFNSIGDTVGDADTAQLWIEDGEGNVITDSQPADVFRKEDGIETGLVQETFDTADLPTDDIYTMRISSRDPPGNETTGVSDTFVFDQTPPTLNNIEVIGLDGNAQQITGTSSDTQVSEGIQQVRVNLSDITAGIDISTTRSNVSLIDPDGNSVGASRSDNGEDVVTLDLIINKDRSGDDDGIYQLVIDPIQDNSGNQTFDTIPFRLDTQGPRVDVDEQNRALFYNNVKRDNITRATAENFGSTVAFATEDQIIRDDEIFKSGTSFDSALVLLSDSSSLDPNRLGYDHAANILFSSSNMSLLNTTQGSGFGSLNIVSDSRALELTFSDTLPSGRYRFLTTGFDEFGNERSDTRTFTIDRREPSVSVTPGTGVRTNDLSNVLTTVSDTLTGTRFNSDSTTLTVFYDSNRDGSFTNSELIIDQQIGANTEAFDLGRATDSSEDGFYRLQIQAGDVAGNSNADSADIIYDTFDPDTRQLFAVTNSGSEVIETGNKTFSDTINTLIADYLDTNTVLADLPQDQVSGVQGRVDTTTITVFSPEGDEEPGQVTKFADTMSFAFTNEPNDPNESGRYQMRITIQDTAGNVRTDTNSFTFDIDEPSATIGQPVDGDIFDTSPVGVTGTASDPTSQAANVVVVADTDAGDGAGDPSTAIDTSVVTTVTNQNWGVSLDLGDANLGDVDITVRAVDNADNTGPISDTVSIKYNPGATDLTNPEISDISASPDPFNEDSNNGNGVEISYNLSEDVDTTTILMLDSNGNEVDSKVIDDQPQGTNNEFFSAVGKVEDEYTFDITVTDFAGLQSQGTNQAKATLDRSQPVITIDSTPSPNPFSPDVTPGINDSTDLTYSTTGADQSFVNVVSKQSGDVMVNQLEGTVSGDTSNRTVTWDGQPNEGDGDYQMIVKAVDDAGNVAEKKAVVEINNTPFDVSDVSRSPSVISPANEDGNFDTSFITMKVSGASGDVELLLQVSDTASNLVRTDTKVVSSSGDSFTTFVSWGGINDGGSYEADGVYDWDLTVTNKATDQQITRSGNISVDNTAPGRPSFSEINGDPVTAGEVKSISGDSVSAFGTADPLTTIEVIAADSSAISSSTQADVQGEWTINSVNVSSNNVTIRPRAFDSVQNISVGDSVILEKDKDAPVAKISGFKQPADNSTGKVNFNADTNITVVGSAHPSISDQVGDTIDDVDRVEIRILNPDGDVIQTYTDVNDPS